VTGFDLRFMSHEDCGFDEIVRFKVIVKRDHLISSDKLAALNYDLLLVTMCKVVKFNSSL